MHKSASCEPYGPQARNPKLLRPARIPCEARLQQKSVLARVLRHSSRDSRASAAGLCMPHSSSTSAEAATDLAPGLMHWPGLRCSKNHTRSWKDNLIPTVPTCYLAKPEPRERAWENQRGKKTLFTSFLAASLGSVRPGRIS